MWVCVTNYWYLKSCEVSYMGIKVMHVHTVALLIMNSINAWNNIIIIGHHWIPQCIYNMTYIYNIIGHGDATCKAYGNNYQKFYNNDMQQKSGMHTWSCMGSVRWCHIRWMICYRVYRMMVANPAPSSIPSPLLHFSKANCINIIVILLSNTYPHRPVKHICVTVCQSEHDHH